MKIVVAIFLTLISFSASAQNNLIWGKLVWAKDSLKIKDYMVNAISNDSSAGSKNARRLITEGAAKKYTDYKFTLSLIDTTGKFIGSVYKRADSIFYAISGVEYFAFVDASGSGGISLATVRSQIADSLNAFRSTVHWGMGGHHISIRDSIGVDGDTTKLFDAVGLVAGIRKSPTSDSLQQYIDGVWVNTNFIGTGNATPDSAIWKTVYRARQDSSALVAAIAAKQNSLVAGVNIANINGQPIVGGPVNVVVNGMPHTDVISLVSNNKFIVIGAGVARLQVILGAGNTPIVVGFIDSTTSHDKTFFDSVTVTGNTLNVHYAPLKKPIYFGVNDDETYASKLVIAGGSFGNSVTNIYAYIPKITNGELVGNGTNSPTVNLLGTPVLNSFDSTTGAWSFTPNANEYLSYRDNARAYIFVYQGNHNYHVRNPSGSTGGAMVKFYLVDNATGADVLAKPDVTDRIAMISPKITAQAIPMQTTTSNGAGSDIHLAQSNFWLSMIGERFIIASPSESNQMLVEWQWNKSGSANYATNYRITRATLAAPTVETTIYNGFSSNRNADGTWSFTDTGVTTGNKYIYYYYCTILGTETKVSWVTAGAK